MTFLSPLFLLGAAAAVVPIVLHLLRRQPEQRVRFAAVTFLKTAPVEHSSRRRLREWLLLALRVTALLLLALAFARPFFRRAGATGSTGTTVVALDTSYSMSGPARFDKAKAMASEAIRSAPPGHDVAVVTFADQAAVLLRPTPDRGAALAAVAAVAPGFGSTRYRTGLNTSGALVARRGGTIVVVTDLQETGWDAGEHATIPDGTRVEIRDVGPLPENLAITGLRFESDRAIATIRNTGSRNRLVRARLRIDGKETSEASVPVEAHESAEALLSTIRARGTASPADGGVAAVTIDDADGIQADNVRYALMSEVTRPTVLVATTSGDLARDAFYLQQALAAGRSSTKTDVEGVSTSKLSAWTADQVARHAAVVLLSTRGLEPRGRETLSSYVAAGGGLLVAAGPDVDGNVVADVLGRNATLQVVSESAGARIDGTTSRLSTLAPADVRHPIFRAFGNEVASLGLVTFRSAAQIGGSTCQTLAKFTSGDAALVDCASGSGHAVVVASDLNNEWNDFPLRASFVPFVHETVRYLSTSRERAGDYVVGEVPGGVPPVPGVVTPPVARSSVVIARKIVVNVDTRESDPSRIPADEFQAAVTQLEDAGATEARAGLIEQESGQHLWQFLLALMIATLAVEGVVAARSA
jgi:hypothetical protein